VEGTYGYLHLHAPMSMADYEFVASRLGIIILRSDVKVDIKKERQQEESRVVKGRGGIYSPNALGLHTDPIADLVSWYCVEQDDTGGAMQVLDLGHIQEHFSPEELELLTKAELLSPSRTQDGMETLTPVPLVSKKENGGYRLFYVPWLFRPSYDDETSNVLKKFMSFVKEREETQLTALPVKPGESIFLDNGRVLHGRSTLQADSKRHLLRFYLRTRRAA
jgi:Taurine catabolism dioxygenase TauD, TfdA family